MTDAPGPTQPADRDLLEQLRATQLMLESERRARIDAEHALAISEARSRDLVAAMDEGFVMLDAIFDNGARLIDFAPCSVNPAFERRTGILAATVLGKPLSSFRTHIEGFWFDQLVAVMCSGEPAHVEQFAASIGRWLKVHIYALPDERRLAIVFSDITEQRQAIDALRRSEERLRRALDIETVGVVFFETTGEITDANDAFLRMSGYDRQDLALGRMRWDAMTPPEWLPVTNRAIADFKRIGRTEPYEKEYIRKDGSRFPALFAVTRLDDGVGIKFVIDATSSKQAESERKELERQKDEFFAIASHELRTPVTSIKGYAQVLTRRFQRAGDEVSAAFVAKMDAQIDRLATLIRDLFDFTSLASTGLRLQPAEFDLDELIREVMEQVALLPSHHRFVRCGRADRHVVADRSRIGQVLLNLLSNAMKYSPPDGEIDVVTETVDGGVTLRVSDHGIGIPKDQQAHVFDRLHRISTGDNTNTYPGLGLGLYVSAELVRRQHGRIWVESVENEGSTFSFWLPAAMRPAVDGGR